MNYRPVAIEDFDPSSWYGEGLPDMRWNQCHDDLIEDMWEQAFNSKPYTTLCMINYLLRAAKISCVDYLRQPDILQRRLQEHGIESLLGDHNDLEDLIALPGRCTSFALHVAQLVESLAPRSPGKARPFNFLFYDFDNHRLAWCPTSKRLIDSSSLLGTPRMEEDEWLDNPDATRSWKAKGEGALSKMQESGKPPKAVEPSSRRECIVACLQTLVSYSTNPLCLFRQSIKDSATLEDIVTFRGIVEWQMRERQKKLGAHPSDDIDEVGVKIRLAPSLKRRNKDRMVTYIIWDATGTGTPETHKECMECLAQFCNTYGIGGTHVRRQWTSCEIDHWCLWRAACKLWGYPYFELSPDWYTQDESLAWRDDQWGRQLAFWFEPRGILRTNYEPVQGSKVSLPYAGGKISLLAVKRCHDPTNKAKFGEIDITEEELVGMFRTHLPDDFRLGATWATTRQQDFEDPDLQYGRFPRSAIEAMVLAAQL